ncbi:LdpA C-terminal domain-containing domain [Spirulina major CS-329]|uniref:circadian clock protein LdpA n=1 Tax=Spirulina TaxID=1154 RepID=UPI00232DDF91|nr:MULTISPECIES: LdpA C-terminal domain-containing domain [Spirulina]MDB9497047.1 LdpA C-terminal domain-containing domain [Spirulina subsalsa CS-330]MDB9501665.1 LdpA C-terminal domain-containing domain [Spirulina major CS-329]
MNKCNSPLHAIETGQWFKLICGASFQHLPAVRNLALAYTLAGADCIDLAADPAVIQATQVALRVAAQLRDSAPGQNGAGQAQPWLMVSLNDGVDPHFRKAEFDPNHCPADCPRPCEAVCPTAAIAPATAGVIDALCYGCGRCLPVCPSQLIQARSSVSAPELVVPQLVALGIDAVEIHTQVGNLEGFKRVWQVLRPWCDQASHNRASHNHTSDHSLKLLAISCPDHPDLLPYLQSVADLLGSLPCALLWQTDGRPMSGDIGPGTTHASIKLAAKVLGANLPGRVQLAGGTNAQTVPKLATLGLLAPGSPHCVAGVGYGGYARQLLAPVLESLARRGSSQLEDHPDLLGEAVRLAATLVHPLKPQAGKPRRDSRRSDGIGIPPSVRCF